MNDEVGQWSDFDICLVTLSLQEDTGYMGLCGDIKYHWIVHTGLENY